jgi:hypothetical protein
MKRRKLNDMLSAMKRISRSEIYSRTVESDPVTSGLQARPESAAASEANSEYEPVVESDPVTSELQARPESAAASEANSNFSAEAGHLSEMLGTHAKGLTRLGSIDKAEEDKQLADLGIQTYPGEVRQVLQLPSTSGRRRGRSGGLPTDAGALDHFILTHLAQEYKQRKKKVQSGTGKGIP